jgi:AhpD family alkylhydroperoxidase
MNNPALVLPNALKTLLALNASIDHGGVPKTIVHLVRLRASQINGCSLCVDMHAHELKQIGERDERLFAVAAWRDATYFTPAERAALGLAEAVTRLSDREDPVPDTVWSEAERHFDEPGLAALLLVIGQINVWNRLNVATRQPGDGWKAFAAARATNVAVAKSAAQ